MDSKSACGLIGIIYLSLVSQIYAGLPSGISPCDAGDEQCILNVTESIVSTYYAGNSEMNLLQFDPLIVPEMVWEGGPNSVVGISLLFNPLVQHDHKTVSPYKAVGFGADIAGPHEIYFAWPLTHLLGNYSASGDLFGLPVKGHDNLRILTSNLTLILRFDGEPVERDNETYLNVKNFTLNYTCTNIEFDLNHLYDGFEIYSGLLKYLLNYNWQLVGNEMYSSIALQYGNAYEKIVSAVFNATPYNELIIIA